MKKQKGFTLIELLIVIAVIGILASVVLVGIGPIQKQGRDARRINDLRQIQNGLELYYAKNGSYPTAQWGAFNASTLINANIGVTNVPTDPSPGKTYNYESNGTTYCLGAQLEDLTNPNWKRSVGCNSNCFDGSSTASPQSNNFYCVSV
ncbi:MAG: type II secretion system protein [bacterium]|nr:type II secretion system protein [bacterium]